VVSASCCNKTLTCLTTEPQALRCLRSQL